MENKITLPTEPSYSPDSPIYDRTRNYCADDEDGGKTVNVIEAAKDDEEEDDEEGDGEEKDDACDNPGCSEQKTKCAESNDCDSFCTECEEDSMTCCGCGADICADCIRNLSATCTLCANEGEAVPYCSKCEAKSLAEYHCATDNCKHTITIPIAANGCYCDHVDAIGLEDKSTVEFSERTDTGCGHLTFHAVVTRKPKAEVTFAWVPNVLTWMFRAVPHENRWLPRPPANRWMMNRFSFLLLCAITDAFPCLLDHGPRNR
jgi:hypothetical protein